MFHGPLVGRSLPFLSLASAARASRAMSDKFKPPPWPTVESNSVVAVSTGPAAGRTPPSREADAEAARPAFGAVTLENTAVRAPVISLEAESQRHAFCQAER